MPKPIIAEPKTVMGLSVGDLIINKDRQDIYKTTLRRIARISDPRRWEHNLSFGITIWPYPIFSFIAGPKEWQINQPLRESQMGYYSYIHRKEDGRYFDDCQWEITIVEKGEQVQAQASLFAQPVNEDPEPYPYQDGIDYTRFHVWHCDHCNKDFNAIQTEPYAPFHCGSVSQRIMIMEQTPHNPYIESLTRPTY